MEAPERDSERPRKAEPQLMLGEIRTGLLRHSGPITSETTARLLALIPQQMVRRWERPVRHAASPPVLTGVDCPLPSAAGLRRKTLSMMSMATPMLIPESAMLKVGQCQLPTWKSMKSTTCP